MINDDLIRLDVLCTQKSLVKSRTLAKKLIEAGAVTVNGKIIKKPAELVSANSALTVAKTEETEFVSRGGLKLKHALSVFGISVEGVTALDIGASTGGFTDCLLKHGAHKVYAVDVGTSQLAEELRANSKVVSIENTNARYMNSETVSGTVFDIAVADVSFISQTLIYDAVAPLLKKGAPFITLVKPQFEAGRAALDKNGIVRDARVYARVRDKIADSASKSGFKLAGYTDSSITGGDGNKEFLALLIRI